MCTAAEDVSAKLAHVSAVSKYAIENFKGFFALEEFPDRDPAQRITHDAINRALTG